MKNKRGSHVGIIASFTIFVMFLVALVLIFEPTLKTQKNKELVLEYLDLKLKEEFSTNLTTAVISSSGTGCLEIRDSDVGVDNDLDSIVRNSDMVIDSSYISNKRVIATNSNKILWVYYADVNFSDKLVAEAGCEIPTIKSIRVNKQIFEEKILNGIDDFENLTKKMNLPSQNYFGLSFLMENGTIIEAGEKNVSSEIYSRETSIQYFDKDADLLSGKLIIRVW